MPPPPPPTDCPSCWKWTWHRCFHDCCRFHRPPHLKDKPVEWRGFLGVFATKLLLEVCGAAGAVWGSTEVIHWRTQDNAIFFRNLAMITFVIFLIRFYWHAKHWLEHEHDFPYVKIHHRRQHMIHFLQVFCAKFLLQVMGGAGAIWGSSDAVGLRTVDNQEAWRTAAIVTGNVFFLRWVLEIMSYCLLCQRCSRLRTSKDKEDNAADDDPAATAVTATTTTTRMDKWIVRFLALNDWNECITVKFVLEVCGACGAVWGFSEVAGLHTEYTKETVWRPIACVVGAIFAIRWLHQTGRYVFLDHSPVVNLVTEPMALQKRTSVQLTDQRLHVSASVRRVSQNVMGASMRAFGMILEEQDFSDGMSQETPAGGGDREEASNPSPYSKDDIESAPVGSDLRLLVSHDDTKETYNSCDES